MSANIKLLPLEKNEIDIPVYTPSAFIADIESVFGSFPVELDIGDIGKLQVLQKVYRYSNIKDTANPYTKIIDSIEKMGRIRLYAEY